MPNLVLGLKPKEKFYLNDTEVIVLSFNGFLEVKIQVEGKVFKITDQVATEILPHIKVSCGKPLDSHLDKYTHMVNRVQREKEARQRALDDGKLTKEEFDSLPPIEVPYEYLPRLMIEAPREVVILRESLYRRGRHARQQAAN